MQDNLPNIQHLIKNGSYGNLSTLNPALSPLIWTSIATGTKPEKHGMIDFWEYNIDNIKSFIIPRKNIFYKTIRYFLRKMEFTKLFYRTPISSVNRKEPAFWNILSEYKINNTTIGWMASWPAEEIYGTLITDQAIHYFGLGYDDNTMRFKNYNLIYPEIEIKDLSKIINKLSSISKGEINLFFDLDEQEYKKFYESKKSYNYNIYADFKMTYVQDKVYNELFKYYIQRNKSKFYAIYFQLIDLLSHSCLKYHYYNNDRRFNNTIKKAYIFFDRLIGEYIKLLNKDDILIIVSDHGFDEVKKEFLLILYQIP